MLSNESSPPSLRAWRRAIAEIITLAIEAL